MAIELNHTIVPSRDPGASARFLSEILGCPAPRPFGPFHGVALDNGVTLDFMQAGRSICSQHYAFLVGELQFDQIFARIRERRLQYWADPEHEHLNQINRRDGGRGLYWNDPDGHSLEILTRPYGSGG